MLLGVNMMKYLKVAGAFYRYCLIRLLEFRSEFWTWSLVSPGWGFLSLATILLIFNQVNDIAGWTRTEVVLTSVAGSIFMSLLWWMVFPSLYNFMELIRTGGFDFYLLKPINSQFLVSVSRFEFDNYLRVVIMVGLLIFLGLTGYITATLASVVCFVVTIFFGLIIFYSFFFIISTLAIWLINMEGIEDFFDSVITLGRYPTYIYNGVLRVVFFYIIPMAFVATFPIKVLLGKTGLETVVLSGLMAGGFLLASHKFWLFALRHYSSASS